MFRREEMNVTTYPVYFTQAEKELTTMNYRGLDHAASS